MRYQFDEIIDRKNTGCLKYDAAKFRGVPEDDLSLWVADMDFRTAQPIIDRLKAAADTGIYGYSMAMDGYYRAAADWMEKQYGWRPDRSWFVLTPGVCFALAMMVRAFTAPGEKVLIHQPVYYPFSNVIRENGRIIETSALEIRDGHYTVNFEDFERKVSDPAVRMFILCNPHNPGGRAWSGEEIRRMADLCLRENVLFVSDEIHADFVWNGRHNSLFLLPEKYRANSIVCTAPSKTFNLAGLQLSNIFIPNPELRRKFRAAKSATGYDEPNYFGLAACEAAYTEGGDWLSQVKAYIRDNILFMRDYFQENLPMLRMMMPEATYLVWVDMSALGFSPEELNDFILHRAKLWLDDGAIFGKEGAQFERFNAACPRSVLKKALDQLASAIKTIS